MTSNTNGRAKAVADVSDGLILASVEIAAAPARVFEALASDAVCEWWVRPGVFDTREWSGDLHVGGKWRAAGVGGGKPYVLEGEFLEVDPPMRLIHTWQAVGSPGKPSIVAYHLEAIERGTRLTLRHSGIGNPTTCMNTAIGWETSFECLQEHLAGDQLRD
jgi:uncharacterized protein YndB with AHSA1/START domain